MNHEAGLAPATYSYLCDLEVQRLRNLDHIHLSFSSGLNMIVGANGAGKTAICEAVSLLFHGRSFRASSTFPALIQQNSPGLQLRAKLQDSQGEVTRIQMNRPIDGSWTARRDGEVVQRLQQITKLLPLMVMAPEFDNLVDSEPSQRRRLLDWLMFHVEHSYASYLKQFQHSLKQRNHLLRTKGRFDDELQAWTDDLVASGETLTRMRAGVLERVAHHFKELVRDTEFQGFEVGFKAGWSQEHGLKQAVDSVRQMELRRRTTLVGPHRADLLFSDESRLVKPFISRGQKKRLSLLFVLALMQFIRKEYGIAVLLMIDDWRAELDEAGRYMVLQMISNAKVQAIISTTELSDFDQVPQDSRMFHVEHGHMK